MSDVSATVAGAVQRAWSSVLGAHSCQAGLCWNESEGDSLKALELWFHIEQELGCKLMLPAFDDSMTPASLSAAIARELEAKAGAGRPPTMFLMPGILGDEPLLARLRAALGAHVRIKVIEYPQWHATPAPASFALIVDAACAQIGAEPACDAYCLCGYSFGGYVAFEAARRLAGAGCRIGFLGLIDSRMSSPAGRMRAGLTLFRRYRHLLLQPGSLLRFAHHVARARWQALALRLARALPGQPSAATLFALQRERNYRRRRDALLGWQLMPLDAPVTLFLSDHDLPDLPADYGWKSLCRQLTMVSIGGSHTSMLEPPQLELLCTHLLAALGSMVA